MKFLRRFLRFYAHSNENHPALTAVCTTGGLALGGDMFCQKIEYYRHGNPINRLWEHKNDYTRTFRFGLVGCILGPQINYFYRGIVRLIPFPPHGGPQRVWVAAKQVTLDQFCFAPYSQIFVFSLTTFFEGGGPKDALSRIKAVMPETLVMNWKVWPFIQLTSFYFVPPVYRILLTGSCAFLWDAYLSYMQHKVIE